MNTKHVVAAIFVGLGVAGWGQSASAGAITSAAAVINSPTPIGSFNFDRTIDQSGLSIGYTSGVTDFATYIASDPKHIRDNSPANYAASFDNPPAVIDYDLGSSMNILQLALWNYPFPTTAAILDFQVFTSDDSVFAVSALAGSFTALSDGNGSINSAQVFDLTDTTARYLRINVLTTANNGVVGLSEVAFDIGPSVQAVPEPGALALFGIGLAGLGYARRRKIA